MSAFLLPSSNSDFMTDTKLALYEELEMGQRTHCKLLKACLDYMICRADFVMYDFVMHDFSVYTGITNHVRFLPPSPRLYTRKENRGR